jgi:hypothetical protein
LPKALLALNAEEVAHALLADGRLQVDVDGTSLEILPEEVEVKSLAKEGFAVAEDGAYVAALVTELTPELAAEGLAREFVRRVQDFRKESGLEVADRIHLYVKASPVLKKAIQHHKGLHHCRNTGTGTVVCRRAQRRCFHPGRVSTARKSPSPSSKPNKLFTPPPMKSPPPFCTR